ncbi:flavin reductase family protein [Poseidonocella sedimentorum]|uniref:NADH-FMN oxidoreductase RutF, flavin reductase (DIM6/NTAB) family n=1 Tax=Poseidonocella sedimentorum TaxID=871652 RepID=A0A1I6D2X7_9RHOB|nr:flavin reductase family protein [Poseidonocella sedimentorum]SFQ99677.1 NADH-FMN oxidoreductase RutF, flavin reductase (DIM6/NTAB) family [Poseidonocella sedimentorum]
MGAAPEVTRFAPDAGNTRLLRDAFGRFATGVTVVTCGSDAGPVAITANSFTSVSLDPALVLWSPARASRRFAHFDRAEHFAIHVLAAEQAPLCWAIAEDAHALRGEAPRLSPEGVPLIDGCLARFECRRKAVYDGGDHAIMLGHVLRAELREDGDALAFFRGRIGVFAAE